jgi:hypothetical protein
MSLVVAAYNQADIVVGSESLSTYTTQAGQPFVPDEEVRKVQQVNPHLALMITGGYASDKIQFVRDYEQAVRETTDLEPAFQELFSRTRSMTIHPRESFQVGLAGYAATGPTFRLVTRQYGDPNVGYVETYPFNYYLSGHKESVELAEQRLSENDIAGQPSTTDIERVIREILAECISKYPETLGGQIEVLVLSKP